MMARFLRLLARFEEHWIADLLGAAALFSMVPIGLFLGEVWGFK